ncbi:uncharacterized protein LOC122735583 [Dromiciops gliroides]|uniref:uncharacterized protein LOC122735583 n=1 Tax=Dromiciops gliroides TaxID=33562 RepID=UPI001CC4A22C|nr:uncharacterized protein LOC122735583 [Dromiciops gliroides]
MAARWSQRRGQLSCRWSLFLLLRSLKLFGIAEALTLGEMTPDISSLLVRETKVVSSLEEEAIFHCRTDFELSDLISVSWYRLNQNKPPTLIHGYFFGTVYTDIPKEFNGRVLLIIYSKDAELTLRDVKLQDSGTYKCILNDTQHLVERYVIFQVIDPNETLPKDENSVMIYSMVGFISAALVVWMISLGIICKKRNLQCPRNWSQEIRHEYSTSDNCTSLATNCLISLPSHYTDNGASDLRQNCEIKSLP